MKNLKNTNEEKAFTATEVGVMFEHLDGSIKLLAESMTIKFEGVDGKFEGIDKRFDSIDRKFDIIDGRLDGIDGRLDGIDGRLDGIDGRLDTIDKKIDILQDDMVEVKFELKRKVDAEQFEKLEKRVVKLEKLSLAH